MLSVSDHLAEADEGHGQVPCLGKRTTKTTVQTQTGGGESLEERE